MEAPLGYSYTNKSSVKYFLHAMENPTRSDKTRTLYFFSKVKKASLLKALPHGYKVEETADGLPVFKKA